MNPRRQPSFYCTIAHNPYVFWDPKMLRFYLAATQFALGDLPAPTTPSAKLTPAVRAQEQLGWRLGFMPPVGEDLTLLEAIDGAAERRLLYLGVSSNLMVSRDISKRVDHELNDDEMRRIRLKLDEAGVRLLTLRVDRLPSSEAACRQLFEFGRRMGIEAFVAPWPGDMLNAMEKCCDEYDMRLAIDISEDGPSLQEAAELCGKCSKRIGIHGSIASWMQRGIDPMATIRTLRDRLVTLEIDQHGADASDVIQSLLDRVRRVGVMPTMFGTESTQSISLFNKVTIQLAGKGVS
jgi:hypothetical protein